MFSWFSWIFLTASESQGLGLKAQRFGLLSCLLTLLILVLVLVFILVLVLVLILVLVLGFILVLVLGLILVSRVSEPKNHGLGFREPKKATGQNHRHRRYRVARASRGVSLLGSRKGSGVGKVCNALLVPNHFRHCAQNPILDTKTPLFIFET